MKSVIRGEYQHRAPPLGELAVGAEQPVHLVEVARRNVPVAREILLGDRGLTRRREGREDVADRVRSLQVEDRQVGPVDLERRPEEPVVHPRLDQDAAQRGHRMAVGIARLGALGVLARREPGQVGVQRVVADRRFGLGERRLRPRLTCRRVDGSRSDPRPCVEKAEQSVGDQQPVDRLGGEGGPEPENRAPFPAPGREVPNRRRVPVAALDRYSLARAGREAGKIEDAVRQRRDAGHHRRPQQRRQRRVLGEQDAARALALEAGQVRHGAIGRQPVEQLPVAAVEPNEEHRTAGAARRDDLSHGARAGELRRRSARRGLGRGGRGRRRLVPGARGGRRAGDENPGGGSSAGRRTRAQKRNLRPSRTLRRSVKEVPASRKLGFGAVARGSSS